MHLLHGLLLSRGHGASRLGGEGGTNPKREFFLPVKLSCSFSPRSIESPSLGFCTDVLLPHLLEDDLGQLSDLELEPDTQNWQHTVGKDVVAGLTQREIDRQEVINGENVPHCTPSLLTPFPLQLAWEQVVRSKEGGAWVRSGSLLILRNNSVLTLG